MVANSARVTKTLRSDPIGTIVRGANDYDENAEGLRGEGESSRKSSIRPSPSCLTLEEELAQ
ncbi:hypothetical protein ACLOJK_004095, partial [Asimina triloba]